MYKNLEQYLDICKRGGRDEFQIVSVNHFTVEYFDLISDQGYKIVDIEDKSSEESCWYNYVYHVQLKS